MCHMVHGPQGLAIYAPGHYTILVCREDAVRLGLFIGGFTGSYHLISGALRKWQGSLPPAQNCMAAGTAAGDTPTCPAFLRTLLATEFSCTAKPLFHMTTKMSSQLAWHSCS